MTGSPDITVLQLKKAGEGTTLRITKCAPMKVGSYPEVSFVGVDASGRLCEVRVPQKSADRQLERQSLTYELAIGQTLIISRSPNGQQPAKPFWDVVVSDTPIDGGQRVASSTVANTAAASRPEHVNGASPVETVGPKKRGAALYVEITEFTLEKVVPLYVKRGIPVTMEGTAACIATMFIQANR